MNSFLNDFSQLKTFSAKRAQGKSITKECYYFLNCFLPTFKWKEAAKSFSMKQSENFILMVAELRSESRSSPTYSTILPSLYVTFVSSDTQQSSLTDHFHFQHRPQKQPTSATPIMPYDCTSWKWVGMDPAGSNKTGSNDWNPSMRHQCCLWTRGWTLGFFFPGYFIRKPRRTSKKWRQKLPFMWAANKTRHWQRGKKKKYKKFKETEQILESTMLHVILIVSILWLWKIFHSLSHSVRPAFGKKCVCLLYWLLWSITLGCECANAMLEACRFNFLYK